MSERADGLPVIAVGADQTLELRVLVTTEHAPGASSVPVTFTIKETDGPATAKANDHFFGP